MNKANVFVLLYVDYQYVAMRKVNILFVIIALISIKVNAQTPDWAIDSIRKVRFNESIYLAGYASEKNTAKEDPVTFLNRIESYAKGQLIEYIQVRVKSEATQEITEVNDNLQKRYKAIYSASSNLELSGLKIEKSYDPKTKMGYAIAYAKKSELFNYYKGLIESGLTKVAQKVDEAKNALAKNDIQYSLKACLESSNLLVDIEQSQRVLLAIKTGSATEADIQNSRTEVQRSSIEDIIRQGQQNSGNTVDDASLFLARGLKLQTGNIDKPIMITNFTYQDTKMSSELSRRLNQSIASKIVSDGGFKVATENASGVSNYILTGTYWKEEKDVKLIGILKDNSGKIVATAEAFVPLSWFQTNNVSFLPENFEEASKKMRVFGKDEIVKGDLNLEVLTNKGDENLLYTEGESLKFYVRVNKECYLRFVYYSADGSKVLLLDNYYIAENMVNKMVELPFEFECSAPFGVETLQANAQTSEFDKLNITHTDGFDFINETLDQVLINTRSFKKAQAKEPIRAEQRLVFTTMKK